MKRKVFSTSLMGLVGMLVIRGAEASDIDVSVDWVAIDALEGISSWLIDGAGDLVLTMDDGNTVRVQADDISFVDDVPFLSPETMNAAGLTAETIGVSTLGANAAVFLVGTGVAAAWSEVLSQSDSNVAPSPIGTADPAPATNDVPVFSSSSTVSVSENQATGFTAAATDNNGDTLTYAISGGADATLFDINANTGEVSFRGAPDFELAGDSDADNTYDLIISATDGTATTEQTVSVSVTNVNDVAPVFSSPAAVTILENQTVAFDVAASDAEGNTLTYSLSGADAALFVIDADSGVVTFIDAPDFEAPADANGDNVYDIVVTASDGVNTSNQVVAVAVTDANDMAPQFNSATFANIAENQATAYAATASDAESDALTYSLSGTDAALFTIDTDTGIVAFIDAPDFEAPADTDGNNIYDIVVTASDGANTTDQAVAIMVTNTNDIAPQFNSADSTSVAENQTVAYSAIANDAEGDTLTYSISGADAASFSVDASTGLVTFVNTPDFENPEDDGADNVYDITISASDGVNTTEQTVAISVTDENDIAPAFNSSASVSVQENQTAAFTANASDVDGDAVAYSLSGADAALFTIDVDTGVVAFINAPDFENPADTGGNNVYDLTVTATDGINSTDQAVTVSVTNSNDVAPLFSSPMSATVAENQSNAFTALASDPEGDALTYTLGGTDAALFNIDADTGAVTFVSAADFENPTDNNGNNTYDLIVTASDGVNSIDHTMTLTVTNVNDIAPIFSSANSATVAENQTNAFTATATDAEGDALTYSLSGIDAALFNIDTNTGEVTFIDAPDFETPADVGGDNTYDVVVTASDGVNTTDQNVSVTVTDTVDGIPVFSSPSMVSIAENQTVAFTAMASDSDGDTITYALGGPDGTLFSIDENSGTVEFIANPDFENPDDSDGDNVYQIVVTASDGINNINQAVTVTVTDVDDTVQPTPVINLGTLGAADGFLIAGEDPMDFAGQAVAFAGDINGDGFDDMILGNFDNEDGGSRSGAAYVVYGTDSGFGVDVNGQQVIDTTTLSAAEGFVMQGRSFGSLGGSDAGFAASHAGDVNGDGFDDLLVGARTTSFGTQGSGEAYIVFGGDNGFGTDVNGRQTLELGTLSAAQGFVIQGDETFDNLGGSVSLAGDINGDGYGDVIVGAAGAGANNVGESYVVFGGDSGFGSIDNGRAVVNVGSLDASEGFVIRGHSSGIQSGNAVSTAGDFNGDGFDDLIVGTSRGSTGGTNSGEAYVVYGTDTGFGSANNGRQILDLTNIDPSEGFRIQGDRSGDQLGNSVASAGDINGDGFDDLVVGAPLGADGGATAGEAYVVFGRGGGIAETLDLSDMAPTDGFIIQGPEGNAAGHSVSSAGDINGDGYADLIIAAPSNNDGGDPNSSAVAGAAFVVFGGADGFGSPISGRQVLDLNELTADEGFVIHGAEDQILGIGWGNSVSSAGDVNGDGYDDLFVGTPGDSTFDQFAGGGFVIFGSDMDGSTSGQLFVGTSFSESLVGNDGDDELIGNGGTDSMRGGAGDDLLRISDMNFADVEGGTGRDTLCFDGAGDTLDLVADRTHNIDSIEVIDLGDSGANTLVLDQLAVFNLTEERNGGSAVITVRGGADDTVDFDQTGWTSNSTIDIDGMTFDVYENGNAQVQVQQGINVTALTRGQTLNTSNATDPLLASAAIDAWSSAEFAADLLFLDDASQVV